jgi:hypothetical protein
LSHSLPVGAPIPVPPRRGAPTLPLAPPRRVPAPPAPMPLRRAAACRRPRRAPFQTRGTPPPSLPRPYAAGDPPVDASLFHPMPPRRAADRRAGRRRPPRAIPVRVSRRRAASSRYPPPAVSETVDEVSKLLTVISVRYFNPISNSNLYAPACRSNHCLATKSFV